MCFFGGGVFKVRAAGGSSIGIEDMRARLKDKVSSFFESNRFNIKEAYEKGRAKKAR